MIKKILKYTASAILGTLIVASVAYATILFPTGGGTGWGAIKAGFVMFGNDTSPVATSSALFFDKTNSRLGIGTTSPKEALNISGSTGYITARLDSGVNSGYISVNDAFPAFNMGSNNNIPTQFVQNNTPVANFDTSGNFNLGKTSKVNFSTNIFGGYLYLQGDGTGDNGEDTIVVVNAPAAQPQEADLSLNRAVAGGNREFSDLDNECYSLTDPTSLNTNCYDHFDSWVVAKQGTGQLRPWGVRFWNQDAGDVASKGVWGLLIDPSGAMAVGPYASTTSNSANKYDKTIPLQVSSSTASTVFAVDAAPGAHVFTVSNAGVASTTNLRVSLLPNCTGSNAFQTNSTGLVSCGAVTTGSGTVNSGAAGQFAFYSALGTTVAGSNFAYASSTNGGTVFGANAGGTNVFSSGTVQGTTAIGNQALNALLAGTQNTAVGYQAMLNATSSNQNTAVGYASLKGNPSFLIGGSNTAVGYLTMTSIQAGVNNTAMGGSALTAITTGNSNTCVGLICLTALTQGGQNTAMGQGAAGAITTGSSNTVIGYAAMSVGTNGDSNTVVGREAQNYSAGSNNTAVGYRAGFGVSSNNYSNNVFLGYQSANAITTGSGNVLAGYQAGNNLTTGSANIILGQNVTAPVVGNSGQLNIGNLIFGTGLYNNSSTPSATAVAGFVGVATTTPWRTLSVVGTVAINGLTSSTAGNAVCILANFDVVTAGNTTCVTSSKFTKSNIKPITSTEVSELMKLNPVSYINKEAGDARFGLIAEEAATVDPRIVEYAQAQTTLDGHVFKKGDVIAVDYERMVGLVVAGYQSQQKQIDSLKNGVVSTAKSAEDNWQWLAIGLLVMWNLYLTFKKRNNE